MTKASVRALTDLETRPLPTPTRDVEVAKRDMDEFGYALIADALSKDQVAALVDRLMVLGPEEAAAAGAPVDVSNDTSMARIFQLLNKGKVWQALLDPTDEVHQVLEHVFTACFSPLHAAAGGLEQKYILSSTGAKFKHKDVRPERHFHTDQGWAAGYQNYPLVCTTFYALSDFNVENGCTWVVPGSHKVPAPPINEFASKGASLLKLQCRFRRRLERAAFSRGARGMLRVSTRPAKFACT